MPELDNIARMVAQEREGYFEQSDTVFAYDRNILGIELICYLHVQSRFSLLGFRTYCTIETPSADTNALYAYLNFLNRETPIGTFVYNNDTRELRYKSALCYKDAVPSIEVVRTLRDMGEHLMTCEIPFLLRIHGGESVESVLLDRDRAVEESMN